ncbi:aldolase [Pseudorhodoferax sp. Leaf274]|nr:aldolase [Pseudorhodoferax sp. Leaf274]
MSDEALRASLHQGLVLETGPFRFRIHSRTDEVFHGLRRLYADFSLPDPAFADYVVEVNRVHGPRAVWRPQISFSFDGYQPFKPLPADHAFALLEWGMNWCIGGQAHHYLLIHAAVLERNGRAVILPGDPGAGKSTLTAALALSGWRLLSDEIALIDRDDGLLVGLARPVNLKNDSIDIVRAFSTDAVFGEPARDTHKGTVAHLKPPTDSVLHVARRARPAFIIYPRWSADAPCALTPRPKADAFMHTATHAFNYEVLGSTGFDMVAALVDQCECLDFRYAQLPDAIALFESLVR